MSVQSIKPFTSNAFTSNVVANATDAKFSLEAKPFIRNAAAASTGWVVPPLGHSYSKQIENWRDQVLGACKNLRLDRGEKKDLLVHGEPMVVRRTACGDAYVFQSLQASKDEPFSGLHLHNNGKIRYNMKSIFSGGQQAKAVAEFSKLGVALGVPHGGFGVRFNLGELGWASWHPLQPGVA